MLWCPCQRKVFTYNNALLHLLSLSCSRCFQTFVFRAYLTYRTHNLRAFLSHLNCLTIHKRKRLSLQWRTRRHKLAPIANKINCTVASVTFTTVAFTVSINKNCLNFFNSRFMRKVDSRGCNVDYALCNIDRAQKCNFDVISPLEHEACDNSIQRIFFSLRAHDHAMFELPKPNNLPTSSGCTHTNQPSPIVQPFSIHASIFCLRRNYLCKIHARITTFNSR